MQTRHGWAVGAIASPSNRPPSPPGCTAATGRKTTIALNSNSAAAPSPCWRCRSSDGLGEPRSCLVRPAARDRHQFVRSIPQLLDEIVDQQVNATVFADHPRQGLSPDRLGRGKNHTASTRSIYSRQRSSGGRSSSSRSYRTSCCRPFACRRLVLAALDPAIVTAQKSGRRTGRTVRAPPQNFRAARTGGLPPSVTERCPERTPVPRLRSAIGE